MKAFKHKDTGDVHIAATDDKGELSYGGKRMAESPEWEELTPAQLKKHLGKEGVETAPSAVRNALAEPASSEK